MRSCFVAVATLVFSLSLSLGAVAQPQPPDHPLVGRFAGAEVVAAKDTDFDALTVPLGPAYRDENKVMRFKASEEVEGKVTWRLYRVPKGKSVLQVYRNHERALKQRGFEPLFSCTGNRGCGFFFRQTLKLGALREYAGVSKEESYRFLAARAAHDKGQTYVLLAVYEHSFDLIRDLYGRTLVDLRVVDVAPLKDEITTVAKPTGKGGKEATAPVTEPLPFTSQDLATSIAKEGRAAVNQIYFETDSAVIKPESRPALEAIAQLLRDNPGLKVLLVGHTDNRGGLQYNMDLSNRRATAVRDALVKHYGIAPARLGAAGVGFLAPVATNTTPEGRAKNRRVELVEWPPDVK